MGETAGLGKGYQFARAQVLGRHDVLVLGGFLHPGRTVPPHCLKELVALVEVELGAPRRRVEVVEQRLQRATAELARIEEALAERAVGPAHVQRRTKRLEAQRERAQQEVDALRTRRDALVAENRLISNPRRIILRLDGGFGDAENLAWLYEQGYDVVARVHNHRVAQRLRQEEGLCWEKVSKNGFIAESQSTLLGSSPYPLRLFACRQWWGSEKPERWSALAVTPDLGATTWPARRVGVFYNERQVMEAGIKEGKGIFASRHLPTRHQDGIALYQELVLAAQNLLRWFRRQVLHHSLFAQAGVKQLVRIVANSRALVSMGGGAMVVCFAPETPWPNLLLSLRLQISYQLWLPGLDECWQVPAGP
jgi:hypothetical protein